MAIAEITVPGSTSNLGSSFDTCGLAISLYLRVAVESRSGRFEIVTTVEGSSLPRDESNLIARVARFAAEQRKREISGARLRVENQIPLSRGLGSSSAAIIAGLTVYEVLADERLSENDLFRLALNFEGHGDNLAPALLGGLVVVCEAAGKRLLAVRRDWPAEIRLVAVIPEVEFNTEEMRRVLPKTVSMEDAVFNVQRAALLQAALAGERYEVITEALRDRLHQPFRAPLIPAAEAVIALNDRAERYPGLLGITISGAGSTMAAFSTGDTRGIAKDMVATFAAAGVRSRAVELTVDNQGRRISFQ